MSGMYRLLRILLCALCLHGGVALAAPDFSSLVATVERYRGGNSELRIDFDEQEFRVLEGQRQALSVVELRRLESGVLSMGDRGRDVLLLQLALMRTGHFKSAVDSEFGPATRTAVVSFQTERGMTADGQVGPATRKALGLPQEAVWKSNGEPVITARGPRTKYQVHDTLELELRIAGNGSSWMKIPFAEISSQPRARWTPFVAWLVDRGLLSYEQSERSLGQRIELAFAASGPTTPLGANRLTLSPQTQRLLKVSQRYPSRAPQGREWVILIHEPHSDLTGQLQLVPGLDQLARANPELRLKFLVEGKRFEGACGNSQACDIPLAAMDPLFSKDPPVRRQQVYYLLRNYLIDSAMAYRLLYDPVPAIAIDDQAALARSPRSTRDGDALTRTVLQASRLLAEEDPESQEQSQRLDAAMTQFKTFLEIWRAMPDDPGAITTRYQDASAAFRNLAGTLRKIDRTRYEQSAAALEQQAGVLDDERKISEEARVRDVALARSIVDHYQSSDASRIPVVFIGSAHTPGMIARLPAGFGYVVLEPRISDRGSGDWQRFQDGLHDYPRTLAAADAALMKLPVSPPIAELPNIRELTNRIATKVTSRPALDGAALDARSTDALRKAIDANPFFNLAEVQFATAGGGQMPPPPFEGAFASYSPGGGDLGGFGGKLQLLPGKRRNDWDEPARTGWQKADRLEYLQQVVLRAPKREGAAEGRTVSFYRDRSTHRTFICVYEPEHRKYYFLESDRGLDGLQALVDPVSGTVDARARLSRVLDIQKHIAPPGERP